MSGADPSAEDIFSRVRETVIPDDDERERMDALATKLLSRAEATATDCHPDADALQVGSTARDTWVSGDRDVDIFVRFPPELDRETLERYGLRVGHETLPDGREEYAEHPYVTGTVDGFDVDIVPCYRLEDATEIQSAVDRTPFHDQYLRHRLTPELTDEVRLAKAFTKGIGVYGSNLRTRGFSGYLTELLVCEYESLLALCEAAADWQPPVELDPEGHGHASFDDPLVLIDPTDPERNVAAVCSAANVARFQHHARAFLTCPTIDPFEPDEPEPLTEAALHAHLDRRGTTPIAIRFDAPDVVDDQLYPQLRKSLAGLTDALDRRGFDVVRAETFADETAVLFVEVGVAERSAIERHEGPPVGVRKHAEGFFDAYADDPDTYGPFIDGDRYAVERAREFVTVRGFLESDALFKIRLGTHVESALETDYDVFLDEQVTALCDEHAVALARYFEPTP